MDKSTSKSHLGIMVTLGAVWGLSEAALGMGLRSCAAFVSGAIMTGVAFFFMAAAWKIAKKISGIFLIVLIAAGFKLFDALLLSLPINHGAIGNPIFAFFMEAAAFIIILSIIKEKLQKKAVGHALIGGMAAVLAVNLFPLVKYATAVPACVVPGTAYPLSLYYIHFAVLTSIITVPLGFLLGAKLKTLESRLLKTRYSAKINYILSPAALLLCLVIITIMRLI